MESSLPKPNFTSAIDFTYYPNPPNGSFIIKSKSEMSEVFVYNLEGRLLSQQKINGLDTKVDLSAFANGAYFFKCKFSENEVNLKSLNFN